MANTALNFERNRHVAIVVLGDLGRSPRMQYHALALAETGIEVDLIGYSGNPPIRAVRDHRRIRLHPLAAPLPRMGRHLPQWVWVWLHCYGGAGKPCSSCGCFCFASPVLYHPGR